MAWYGWLFLIAVLAVPGVLCAILYDRKHDATPCIGCGECIRTGECVLIKQRQKAKKAAEAYKKAAKKEAEDS